MRAGVIVVGAFLCFISPMMAQQNPDQLSSRAIFDERLNTALADGWLSDDEAHDLKEVYEAFLHKPLLLNAATLADLKRVPFLSEYKALKLLSFRAAHQGRIQDVSMLKEIPDWDDELCTLLYPLLSISPETESRSRSLKELTRGAKSRLSLLAGYNDNKAKNSLFVGSGDAVTLRYRCLGSEHLSLALAVQKDHYEPWTYEGRTLPDSYHGHLALRNMGAIKTLVLGQYRVSWGEGLVLGQGLSFYQSADFLQGRKQGVSLIYGTTEQGYSQGIALESRLSPHLGLDLVTSWRRLDGAVEAGTLRVKGLVENGLHRDSRSLWRKWQVPFNHYGVRLRVERPHWSWAVQGLYYDFGHHIVVQPPRSGSSALLKNINHFALTSLSGSYHNADHSLSVSGELASTEQGAMALYLRSAFHLGQSDLLAEAYALSPHYWSYTMKHTSYMSRVQDALGVHISALMPFRFVRFNPEVELYRQGLSPTSLHAHLGYYVGTKLHCTLSRSLGLSLRLGERSSEYVRTQRFRATLDYQHKSLRTSACLLSAHDAHRSLYSLSWATALITRYAPSEHSGFFISATYYDAPLWSERLYLTRPQLGDEYHSALLYGQGFELNMGANLTCSKHLNLGLRASETWSTRALDRDAYVALQLTYH